MKVLFRSHSQASREGQSVFVHLPNVLPCPCHCHKQNFPVLRKKEKVDLIVAARSRKILIESENRDFRTKGFPFSIFTKFADSLTTLLPHPTRPIRVPFRTTLSPSYTHCLSGFVNNSFPWSTKWKPRKVACCNSISWKRTQRIWLSQRLSWSDISCPPPRHLVWVLSNQTVLISYESCLTCMRQSHTAPERLRRTFGEQMLFIAQHERLHDSIDEKIHLESFIDIGSFFFGAIQEVFRNWKKPNIFECDDLLQTVVEWAFRQGHSKFGGEESIKWFRQKRKILPTYLCLCFLYRKNVSVRVVTSTGGRQRSSETQGDLISV